jgi:DnaK suppressor protein
MLAPRGVGTNTRTVYTGLKNVRTAVTEGITMDQDRARALIDAKRADVLRLLEDSERAGRDDRDARQDTGDSADPAPAFETEAVDDAVAEGLRAHLAALDRAQQRLEEGTYGLSVRSGRPIPDERLEVDPAAELTVEEAAQEEAARR